MDTSGSISESILTDGAIQARLLLEDLYGADKEGAIYGTYHIDSCSGCTVTVTGNFVDLCKQYSPNSNPVAMSYRIAEVLGKFFALNTAEAMDEIKNFESSKIWSSVVEFEQMIEMMVRLADAVVL